MEEDDAATKLGKKSKEILSIVQNNMDLEQHGPRLNNMDLDYRY